MKPIEKAESEQFITNVHINLLAPMILTSTFMKYTKDWKVDKRVINISSGAGKNPYFGWGAYCTTKAGVNMFTQCVATEEVEKEYPVKLSLLHLVLLTLICKHKFVKQIKKTSQI